MSIVQFDPFVPVIDVDVATFDDAESDKSLVKLNAAITHVQAGSGTPAPDNVRAISGYTGASAVVTGKNLIGKSASNTGTITKSGVDFTFNADGTVTLNNTSTAGIYACLYDSLNRDVTQAAAWNGFDNRYVLPNVQITAKAEVSPLANVIVSMGVYNADGTTATRNITQGWTGTCAGINSIFIYIPNNTSLNNVKLSWQVVFGSTATDYTPHISTSYPIDWTDDAGTVYGGSINFTTGELIKTLHGFTPESTDITAVSYYEDPGTTRVSIDLPSASTGVANDVICNIADPSTGGAAVNTIRLYGTTQAFIFIDGNKTLEEARAALETVQIVYQLAEPVTYELTPVEVKTLQDPGVNNVWVDTGKILELYYPIDISYFRRYFMVNSGYILLDGGDIDLTSTDPQLIEGSWDRIVTAMETGKPIWAFNTKYGTGKPLSPVPVFAWYLSATSIVIVGATLHIIVSNTDYCVVQDVASA